MCGSQWATLLVIKIGDSYHNWQNGFIILLLPANPNKGVPLLIGRVRETLKSLGSLIPHMDNSIRQ